MFRLSVINPSISLKRILIYSEVLLWQTDYWRSKLISYTVPISPFHCWSSIITDIIDFPVVFSNNVASYRKKNKRK
jgi:hypothetical protein